MSPLLMPGVWNEKKWPVDKDIPQESYIQALKRWLLERVPFMQDAYQGIEDKAQKVLSAQRQMQQTPSLTGAYDNNLFKPQTIGRMLEDRFSQHRAMKANALFGGAQGTIPQQVPPPVEPPMYIPPPSNFAGGQQQQTPIAPAIPDQTQQTTQVQSQMPIMPPTNGPASLEQYIEMIRKLQPQQEKTWMDSPWYPISLGLMGLGSHLLTPERFRYGQQPFMPMVAAMGQQVRRKDKDKEYFDKALSTYPSYVQSQTRQQPEYTAIYKADGTLQGYAPTKHVKTLPREPEPHAMWVPGADGVPQLTGVPRMKIHTAPGLEGEKAEKPYYSHVYDPVTDTFKSQVMPGRGPVLKRDVPTSQRLLEQKNQSPTGYVRVQMPDGRITIMKEEDAKKAGARYRR